MKNLFVIGLLLGSISIVGNAYAMENAMEDNPPEDKSPPLPPLPYWNREAQRFGEDVLQVKPVPTTNQVTPQIQPNPIEEWENEE